MVQAQQMMAAIGSSVANRPKGSGLFTRALRSSSASVIRAFPPSLRWRRSTIGARLTD